MKAPRVVLVTLAGISGSVDVAVRTDVPVEELVRLVGEMIGHDGDYLARHRGIQLAPSITLADANVVDGDVVEFAPLTTLRDRIANQATVAPKGGGVHVSMRFDPTQQGVPR